MSADTEYSLSQVAEHDSKDNLWVSIHEKVYKVSTFVDEHPGGEEVLLDVAGTDATEAFEDVGHSDEAREILTGLQIGVLKRGENDPKPSNFAAKSSYSGASSSSPDAAGFGIGLYVLLVVGGALAFGAYKYLQAQQEGK